MITVRSIIDTEIDYFVSLADPPAAEHGAIDKQIITDMWAAGTSHPEWCFVAEADGQLIARACYTDVKNTPMIHAFKRAEYKPSERIWKYYAQLDKLIEDWSS